MKGDQEVVAGVLLFVGGATFGAVVNGNDVSGFLSAFVPALATLVAAYVGASYAFRLQAKREKEQTDRENRVAGNLAVFQIGTMLNRLANYQRQIIDPVRDKPLAYIEMRPTLNLLEDDIRPDIEGLSFVLDAGSPDLLGEFMREHESYRAIVATVQDRSRLHVDIVQPAMENGGLVGRVEVTPELLTGILGVRVHESLRGSTAAIIEHVDTAITSLQEVGEKLTKLLKELYPGQRVISVRIPDGAPGG